MHTGYTLFAVVCVAVSSSLAVCPASSGPSGCSAYATCQWEQLDPNVCEFTKCGGGQWIPGNLKITSVTTGPQGCQIWPGVITKDGRCIRDMTQLSSPGASVTGVVSYTGTSPCP